MAALAMAALAMAALAMMPRAACAQVSAATPAATPAAAPAAGIAVSDAYIRAPLPGQDTLAAYFTITASADDALTGIDASGFGMAMLHESHTEGGITRMRDVDEVALPAGQAVKLQPGGTHVMLMDASRLPRAGAHVLLTLHFRRHEDVGVTAEVRALAPARPPGTP